MARKLPQNRWPRSASVGHGNRGNMFRYLLALLACLERAPGQAGAAAALPQIAPMEPVRTPFPRAQRRPLEPGSPAQRFAATRLRQTPQQHRAHHSGKDQSRFPLREFSLSERGSGSSANSPSVSRRSISRLSRRKASLRFSQKKASSFAIPRISFCESNHSSSSLSAGMSV